MWARRGAPPSRSTGTARCCCRCRCADVHAAVCLNKHAWGCLGLLGGAWDAGVLAVHLPCTLLQPHLMHPTSPLPCQVREPWRLALQLLGPPATHTLLAAAVPPGGAVVGHLRHDSSTNVFLLWPRVTTVALRDRLVCSSQLVLVWLSDHQALSDAQRQDPNRGRTQTGRTHTAELRTPPCMKPKLEIRLI